MNSKIIKFKKMQLVHIQLWSCGVMIIVSTEVSIWTLTRQIDIVIMIEVVLKYFLTINAFWWTKNNDEFLLEKDKRDCREWRLFWCGRVTGYPLPLPCLYLLRLKVWLIHTNRVNWGFSEVWILWKCEDFKNIGTSWVKHSTFLWIS